MSGPVLDDLLERVRLSEGCQHRVGDLLDRLLDAGADVVRLADSSVLQHELDRAAMVEDVQPLPLVLRRRVERQRLVVECVRCEQRDHLLGKLVRPVVVRAVRDRRRHVERLVVRADVVIRGGLRRVVGRARPVRRRFAERFVAVEGKVAVDLAGGDVVEARHIRAP